ncbi:MAG: prephenate dehydrogenase/arogenate dehydrogenase family protein [Actinobacteria bacterium]|nr:prephenate dehydrogenase/arogenate dehydrogenase family protein [Actinomycetota bacterium]
MIETEDPSSGWSAGAAATGNKRRACVVGTGLIGGSIALALRARGWHVSGLDSDPRRLTTARQTGAIDEIGLDPKAELTFIATPVAAIASEARSALSTTNGAVTDVGGVKARIMKAIVDGDPGSEVTSSGRSERSGWFVGGHPMAGSEQVGLDGADPDLFVGATWVLTPVENTDPEAFALVRSVVVSLGAEVVALSPARHDILVAQVSHVPHLTAAALMSLASEAATEHAALLRLAAGGFRDMTRVAAGHPGIWPDICVDNSDAIASGLDELMAALAKVRAAVVGGERKALLEMLERAAVARRNLPERKARPAAEAGKDFSNLAELRIPVPDRPGVLAEITTLASALSLNIEDLEIAHTSEGGTGVLIVVIAAAESERFRAALTERGYRPALRRL